MSDFTQKIKGLFGRLTKSKASFERSGISPKLDWKILLITTFILVCVIASISLYLYTQINNGHLFVKIEESIEKEVKIDKKLLDKTINDINIRKTKLEDIKQNNSIPPDPSL